MAHRMYAALALALSVFTVSFLSAQEALKSAEEEYYDFLSIQGAARRGFLNYRTLSDSVWTLEGEAAEGSHVWAGNNLGTRFLLWHAGLSVPESRSSPLWGISATVLRLCTVRVFPPYSA